MLKFRSMAAVVIAGFLLVSQEARTVVQQIVTPTKIMVVGDSISNGFAGEWTWRYRLWQHLQGVSVDFVGPKTGVFNTALGQQTLEYIDPNFDREHDATGGRFVNQEKSTIAGEVNTYQPDILLINMGTNDLMFGGNTGAQAEAQMATLIANARSAKSNVKIVLSLLAPVGDQSFAQRWSDYNNALITYASGQANIVIADPRPGFNTSVDEFDGIHPTPSGEYRYAAAFANALSTGYGIGQPFGTIPSAPGWPLSPGVEQVSAVTGYDANGNVQPVTQATVWWSPPVGGNNTEYVVYRLVGASAWTTVVVSATGYTVTGLTPGATYEFGMYSSRGYINGPISLTQIVQEVMTPHGPRPEPTTPQIPPTIQRPIPTNPQFPPSPRS